MLRQLISYPKTIFRFIRPVHVHLKTDKVDLKKKTPRKNNFLKFFVIHSSSRHEKRCRMLERIFCLFQCSRNQQCTGTYSMTWYQWQRVQKFTWSCSCSSFRNISCLVPDYIASYLINYDSCQFRTKMLHLLRIKMTMISSIYRNLIGIKSKNGCEKNQT